jgi:hypothetical protein
LALLRANVSSRPPRRTTSGTRAPGRWVAN